MATGGQYALASGGQFALVLGGQFEWFFHVHRQKQPQIGAVKIFSSIVKE